MADDDHTAQLMKGAAAWNAWRDENLNVGNPNLLGANLSGANLYGANLGGGQALWGEPQQGEALRGEPPWCRSLKREP